jgi:tetratricopeptide (TPR) repeat protein
MEQAEKLGRESLSINPELPQSLALVGLILAQKGNTLDALPFLKKYTEVAPEEASGWLNLGMACILMDDQEKARAALEKALQLNPRYAFARYGMANIEYGAGDKSKAFEQVSQALEIDPELTQARLLRTKIFIDQVQKGFLASPAAKKDLLDKISQEIKWLKSKNVDTAELESGLKSITR